MNIGNGNCTANNINAYDCKSQLTKYPSYCEKLCAANPECVGFHYFKEGNNSGGNNKKGDGNCIFRSAIPQRELRENYSQTCYIKPTYTPT